MILKYIVIVCLWVFMGLILRIKTMNYQNNIPKEAEAEYKAIANVIQAASVPVLFFASWKIINWLWLL